MTPQQRFKNYEKQKSAHSIDFVYEDDNSNVNQFSIVLPVLKPTDSNGLPIVGNSDFYGGIISAISKYFDSSCFVKYYDASEAIIYMDGNKQKLNGKYNVGINKTEQRTPVAKELNRLKELGTQYWNEKQDLMSQLYDLTEKLNKANSRIYELENMEYPINFN